MSVDRSPVAGDRWLVRHLLPLSHRVVTVDVFVGDDVVFRFVDSGSPSRCSLSAFLRTYVHEAEVLADA